MRTGRILLLCLGLLVAGAAAGAPDPEEAALLERAQLWQSRNRDDLAREFLDRLFRIAPDHPDGLLLLARLQVRANRDAEAAKTFERLREANPGHPAVAKLAALLRIRGADRDRLRQARQLARAGRAEEALNAYRAIFPEVFPDDEMELEYALVLAQTRDGWERAGPLLAALAERRADDPRFRLAHARHLSQRKPVRAETLRTLRELSAAPSVSKEAREAWRSAVLGLDETQENLAFLREYVASEPGDSAAAERLERMARAVERQPERPADPGQRARREGLALLESGRLEAAEARLQEAMGLHPGDAEAVGAMGLLRLRQGRHAEARGHFTAAAGLERAGRAKWEGLARTARYWDLLRQAGSARESGQLDLAERQLREARSLDASEPNSAIDLARVHALQGRGAEAERLYREALALAPGNANALEGLVALLLRGGRDTEAQALVEGLSPERRREIARTIDAMRTARLREKSERLQSQGRGREAIAALEEAAAIDGEDPWLRLDLARLYAAAGDAARGSALFEALLGRRPDDADSAFALALFLSGLDRDSEALAALERVREADRTAGMARLQRRLWASVQGRRAALLAEGGQLEQARKVLAAARAAAGSDGELALEVAGAYARIGDAQTARSLLAPFAASPAYDRLDWRLAHARLLNRMDADAELGETLARIAALGPAGPEQAAEIVDLNLALAIRRADALRAAGEPAKALQVLREARLPAHAPAQANRRREAEARALRSLERWDEAAETYREIRRADPGQQQATLGLVEVLLASGQREQARQEIGRILGASPAADPDLSAELARHLATLGDVPDARALVESALKADPGHPAALDLAGELALRENRVDRAVDYLRRAVAAAAARRGPEEAGRLSMLAASPEAGRFPAIAAAPPAEVAAGRDVWSYRKLAELLDRESDWLSAALDWRSRSGTRGKSRLSAQELPLALVRGWSPAGQWFFRADAARVSSGGIDLADAAEAGTFGSVLLCQPLCASGTHSRDARGVAFNAGLVRDALRVEVGTSPLGFPVVNLLGAVAYQGDLGPLSYSVEASRRPVASSLLSYAGTRDPNTGRQWGGVVATGARVGLSRDSGGDYGAWSSLDLHRLSGRHVQSNDRAQLMAGAYRRFINEGDRLLSVGVTGMLWRSSENAGEFTLGHGGYYSPRSYRSLSLPVTWALRGARTSFFVRASVSLSRAQTRRAPFFPTDPDLQEQAVALAASTGNDPYYSGGDGGRSTGRALAAAVEHQLTPRLFVGGRIELERSTDYTPNRFLLYLRLALDGPAARPVDLLPEPPRRGYGL